MRLRMMFLSSTLVCLTGLALSSMPAKADICGQRVVGMTADDYGSDQEMYTDYYDGRYYFEKLKLVGVKCKVRGGLQSFKLDERTFPPKGYIYIDVDAETGEEVEKECTRMSIIERKGDQFDCSDPAPADLKPHFHAACVEHDLCYKTPGTSRTECDVKLTANMLQICDHSQYVDCDAKAYAFGAAMLTKKAKDSYETAQEWAEDGGCYQK